MSEITLDILEQIQYITALLAGEMVFFYNAAPRRKYFSVKFTAGISVCILAAVAYIPLLQWFSRLNTTIVLFISSLYWLSMMFLTCFVHWFCFEMGTCNILFRCIAGNALETFSTTLVKSLLIAMWFPQLPSQNPVLYFSISISIYFVIYCVGFHTVAKSMRKGAETGVPEGKKHLLVYILIFIVFYLSINTAKTINEWLLILTATPELQSTYRTVQYFSIVVMFLLSFVVLIMLYHIYQIGNLRTERKLLGQLMADKAVQYERTKESIEIINRKCHDLKHQVLALRVASEQERNQLIEETQRAITFYDATVKTGNEVLDTLLTEKNTVCAYYGIRLSCTVNTQNLHRFGVIDLYTILGNALDNAIECVQQFEDAEKKTISLSAKEKGGMMFFSIENYYEKPIQMQGSYPLTSKKDTQNHGIGVKSIDMITKRYGGHIQLETENQIFRLRIMLPIP